jgi:uncharacterized protein
LSLDAFPCVACGICCKHLDERVYGDLRMPNGACKYYDPMLKMCSVYDRRPLTCRIDDFYDAHLKPTYSRKQFYELNAQACLNFMELEGDHENRRTMLEHVEEIHRMEEN